MSAGWRKTVDLALKVAKNRGRGVGAGESKGSDFVGDLVQFGSDRAELIRQGDFNAIAEQIQSSLATDQTVRLTVGSWNAPSGFQSVNVYSATASPGEIYPDDPNRMVISLSGPSSSPPNVCTVGVEPGKPTTQFSIINRGNIQIINLKSAPSPKPAGPTEKAMPKGEARYREGWDKPSVSWAGVDKSTIDKQKDKSDPTSGRRETMLA